MKPRVLQLVDSFHQGGTERQAVQLIRLLVESGRYDLRVACLNREGALLAQLSDLGLGEIPVFPLTGFYNLNFLRQTRALARMLRDEKIEILQTHDFYTNIIGMAAGALARVLVRIAGKRETGSMRTPRQAFVERRAFARAHAIVVNAEAVRDHLLASGIAGAKLCTIYNGVSETKMATLGEDKQKLRESFGIPADSDRAVVTIVANLRHPVKDQETFLRAAARVRAIMPDTVFVLAGEGERTAELTSLADQLGLADSAIFTGRCTRVPELLSATDVCVLTSINEGFSNAILEYMAAGKPVVTTDVGGAREAVIEGESGYIVPVGDDEKMADRIVELLQDHSKRKGMGDRGRAIVVEKFSPAARLRGTERLFAELLRQRSGDQVQKSESSLDAAGNLADTQGRIR
jgi:glycosyltransferase involved in cell wall biosynthesis